MLEYTRQLAAGDRRVGRPGAGVGLTIATVRIRNGLEPHNVPRCEVTRAQTRTGTAQVRIVQDPLPGFLAIGPRIARRHLHVLRRRSGARRSRQAHVGLELVHRQADGEAGQTVSRAAVAGRRLAHRASAGKTSSASVSQSIVPVSVVSSMAETLVVTVVLMASIVALSRRPRNRQEARLHALEVSFSYPPGKPDDRVIARLTTSATSLSVSALSSIRVWDRTVRTTTSAAPSGLKAS